MVCYNPLQGYESSRKTLRGKRKTVFNKMNARRSGFLTNRTVPCNRCLGCRISYSREWAVRCMHESTLHESSSFITLTYNDDFIPAYGALDYDESQRFIKRLREAVYPKLIRYYYAGEYGDLNLRPHFHALIFGYDFPDKELVTVIRGNRIYRSSLLESCWTYIDPLTKTNTGISMGYSSVGSLSFQSAAYVARYMMKKVKGDDFEGRYRRIDYDTGEVIVVPTEQARMSLKPGIAKEWFDRYHVSDVYNKDFVTMGDGKIVRPPKYYDSLLERISPDELADIKLSRQQSMLRNASEFTRERLAAREQCHIASLSRLSRSIYSSKEVLNVIKGL